MKSVNPYIDFNGNAEEAFKFYQTVFGGELQIIRYKDLENDMGLTGEELNQIGNATLPLVGGTLLYGGDVPGSFGQTIKAGNQLQINIEAENTEEAERLFNDLSDGGEVKMPLQKTEWAEKFGMLSDRFNVRWMVMYSGE
ncbi:MAG TPA: VOC family protein [Balneolaceae bacterium]|nr:VOC family protein [Balneolaceae bacterium]